MAAENGEILDSDNIVDILGVSLLDVCQNGHLNIGLLHYLRRFFHNFYSNFLTCPMVTHSQYLSE